MQDSFIIEGDPIFMIWMFLWRQVYYGIIKQNWGYLDSSNGWEFNLVYLSFFPSIFENGASHYLNFYESDHI